MVKRDGEGRTIICEESFSLSLYELAASFGVSETVIIEIVNEAVVPVLETDLSVWSFGHDDIRRIRMVLQLQNDLGLNLSGAALAIELLDEIDRLNNIIKANQIKD